jgi:V/A-type H+-transporting ATPase subunit I
MALEPVVKIEINAHASIMDSLLEDVQSLSVMQIDPHSVRNWESEKQQHNTASQRNLELKKEAAETQRAVTFLSRFEPPIPLLKKFTVSPEELSKKQLSEYRKEHGAESLKDEALEIEKEITERRSALKEYEQKRRDLLPLENFKVSFELIEGENQAYTIISKLERDAFVQLENDLQSDLMYMEEISGDDPVYFTFVYHKSVVEEVMELEKKHHFEPLSFPVEPKTPAEIIHSYEASSVQLQGEIEKLEERASALAQRNTTLRYYLDYLNTEIERESAKENFFFTEQVGVINGWGTEREYPRLQKVVQKYNEASINIIAKDEEETPPVAYKNNPLVSPYELIVNLYSPPNHKEVDPTPILMPFYTVFFGICLTDAGYGLVIAILSVLGLALMKPRGGVRKFLNLFLILGAATFVIGALIGTVFGINFELLPENLAFLREARYKIMIFDSSQDVLTFFVLCLSLGVIHLIAGYLIKIFMLIKSGDWVEAVCDHVPWVFLLLAPVPKVLIRYAPQYEGLLNMGFYILLALWAGIIILFSERNSLNPIKRLGKGLFTLYGVSNVLSDVLSYSRLLALGLATGVIAGVMNTLAQMVKQLPIVGIIGFVGVLIVGHLFNLFISGLSAFVHSIRLQFMEFFNKFYTGEGELIKVFSEKRKYTIQGGL